MFNDVFSALRGARGTVDNVDADEFARLLREEDAPLLLDVRTPGEYAAGHIPGAVNLDMMDPRFRERIDALDRDRSVLLYCRSGSRSYHAGGMMKKMGFEKVYNLARGVLGWNEELKR